MTSMNAVDHKQGITLRQAALVAGFGLLIMGLTVPFAESYINPKLIIPGEIERTVQNILADRGLFLTGIFVT
jgi:hypothetical protein